MYFFHLDITISSVSLTKSPNSIPIAGSMTTYTFNCSVKIQCNTPYCGVDTINIEWSFNNVIITDTSPFVKINTEDTFVNGNDTVQSILTTEGSITTSHAGIYQCRVNLASDTDVVMSNNVTLNVQSKLLTPTTHCVGEGYSTLSCVQLQNLREKKPRLNTSSHSS